MGWFKSLSSVVVKMKESAASIMGTGDPERMAVLTDIRAKIQSPQVNVGYLDPAGLSLQIDALLKLKKEQGQGAYADALKAIHDWGVQVVISGSQEQDFGDVIRNIARVAVPAIIGGVVGAAVERARTVVKTVLPPPTPKPPPPPPQPTLSRPPQPAPPSLSLAPRPVAVAPPRPIPLPVRAPVYPSYYQPQPFYRPQPFYQPQPFYAPQATFSLAGWGRMNPAWFRFY